jgi:hypothetical protein
MYALKSSEARRQYPKRHMLFDYLKFPEPLEEQAKEFLNKSRQIGIQWAQDRIMIFLFRFALANNIVYLVERGYQFMYL